MGVYRYGFNGKENDNEVKGEGNSLDFGLRVYDARIGRWLSSDPMSNARVSWTPYNAMRNNPISNIDPTGGLDEWVQVGGQTLWDDKVTDQKSATQRYGDGATYRGAGYSYTSNAGEKVTLGSNRSFTVNGASQTAVNSTNPYDPGTFTYWNYTNGRNYNSQIEAHRAWQSYSGYHPGESRLNKILRGTAFASMEARREYAGGGMDMFGGSAPLRAAQSVQIAEVAESATAAAAEPTGAFYSVAFEMKLASKLYPGIYRGAHFKAANTALDAAMTADESFGAMMRGLGVSIPKSPAGSIKALSPTNWVWHHDVGVGIMQLVPKEQHTVGSIFWSTLHPNGVGGYFLWGQ